MVSPAKSYVRTCRDKQDRISGLPDELIHRIMSFLDAKIAVQTSALSKRWRFVWTTLPFLNIRDYKDKYKFMHHILSNRDHQSHLSKLSLAVRRADTPRSLVERFIRYAIGHNLEGLSLILYNYDQPYKLSTFSSKSLKKLNLTMELEVFAPSESDYWDLPALKTLHLRSLHIYENLKLDPCLACLPSLTTLHIGKWDLSESSFSFSLPRLTTLCLSTCKMPQLITIWEFPALISLHLKDVILPENMSEIFSTLVNLQNLTIYFSGCYMTRDHFISCPQLVNLKITTQVYIPHCFVVLTPKLSNVTCCGILSVMFGGSELKKLDIKLEGWFYYAEYLEYHPRLMSMLLGLRNARILAFDLDSIQALSQISNLLVSLPSPFHNLKYVKLPREYEESRLPSALQSYLLGGSPGATIVTKLPQDNMIPQTETVSLTAENAALEEPLAASTKGLVDCQYIDKTVSVETLDLEVEEQTLVDAYKVRQIDSPVVGTRDNRVSSSMGIGDFGLWRGYEVNTENVGLLDRIMQKYPETFEHFTMTNKKYSTVRLNMLCTSLIDFTRLSVAEVDSEIIVQYRDLFANLQSLGFDLSWVLSRLNYIEHLRFSKPLITELHAIDCRIDDAKSKVQDMQTQLADGMDTLQNLQTLRTEKMREIERDFGTMGTNLAVGSIGDDLLSGP